MPKYNLAPTKSELIKEYEYLLEDQDGIIENPAYVLPILFLKQQNRRVKNSNFLATALLLDEFENYLHFMRTKKVLHYQHQLLIRNDHWLTVHIRRSGHTIQFLIFETFSTRKYCGAIIKKIKDIIPEAIIYIYIACAAPIGPYTNTALQFDYNCGWFALEIAFRISKINVFASLENQAMMQLSPKNLELTANFMRMIDGAEYHLWSGVTLLFPEFLPAALAPLFISTQSQSTFKQLSSEVHRSVVSTKRGLSLDETIARRHLVGQELFHQQYAPDISTIHSEAWPNKLPKDHRAYKNHAILGFRIKYLQEILSWIKNLSELDILIINQQRTNFFRLTPYPSLSTIQAAS